MARRAGIHIPHLCSLDWAPSPSASCRLCVVEVEGSPKLQTSCTLPAADGMVVHTHTPRILKARRAIVELMVANHPQDCLVCHRSGTCELADLAQELGARPKQYVGMKKDQALDISSPAIWRDPNKCVLCGRCVTMCHQIQGIGAIDFIDRGFRTQVGPGFSAGINVSGCTYCGQCVRVCPTGALMERSQVDAVVAELGDPDTVVVAQIAPAVPATLAAGRSKPQSVPVMLEQPGGGPQADRLRRRVRHRLRRRPHHHGRGHRVGEAAPGQTGRCPCSPVARRPGSTTSSCHRPDLIPHMSTCKSPQQMAGALIKEIYPRFAGLEGKRLVLVSLMPCTAKKYEAQDLGDVDYVLTTRELGALWDRFGIDFDTFEERAPLDPPFAEATGAARLFGGTGGVMEAAVRTAATLVGAEAPAGPLTEARGLDGVKCFTLDVGDTTLEAGSGQRAGPSAAGPGGGAVRHALRRGHVLPRRMRRRRRPALRGEMKDVRKRIDRIYDADAEAEVRVSHENKSVAALYEEYLGRPLGEVSHRLLHRAYTDRSAAAASTRSRRGCAEACAGPAAAPPRAR